MDVKSLPIWNNSDLGDLKYKTWMSKGIYLLHDILNDQVEMFSQVELVNIFRIWTNLLEYGSTRLKKFIQKLEILIARQREIGPINTFVNSIININSIINMDSKGVSRQKRKIYTFYRIAYALIQQW